MSNLLGKRKRRTELEISDGTEFSDVTDENRRRALQLHFERMYEPLAGLLQAQDDAEAGDEEELDDDDDDDDVSQSSYDSVYYQPQDPGSESYQRGSSEFSGFSDDEDNENDDDDDDDDGDDDTDIQSPEPPTVEVVDHSAAAGSSSADAQEASARKAFMSSRLPSSDDIRRALQNSSKASAASATDDGASETAQLANDLALQRLLRESKLLALNGSSVPPGQTSSLELVGRSRHRALDEHLRSLGAKSSVLAQKNMPRAQRMGITKKAVEKERTRRAEAKEAGVVLERERRGGAREAGRRRERGVGNPGVGKFRGGTLTLSKRDVRDIQGPAARRGKGRGRGRVGGGGGGGGRGGGQRRR